MENKHMMAFEIIRGLVAILIAIAVAFIFIFICADDPGEALQCLLIKPIISNGALNVKSILTILGRTTPIIFTGLAVCVIFYSYSACIYCRRTCNAYTGIDKGKT